MEFSGDRLLHINLSAPFNTLWEWFGGFVLPMSMPLSRPYTLNSRSMGCRYGPLLLGLSSVSRGHNLAGSVQLAHNRLIISLTNTYWIQGRQRSPRTLLGALAGPRRRTSSMGKSRDLMQGSGCAGLKD